MYLNLDSQALSAVEAWGVKPHGLGWRTQPGNRTAPTAQPL